MGLLLGLFIVCVIMLIAYNLDVHNGWTRYNQIRANGKLAPVTLTQYKKYRKLHDFDTHF